MGMQKNILGNLMFEIAKLILQQRCCTGVANGAVL